MQSWSQPNGKDNTNINKNNWIETSLYVELDLLLLLLSSNIWLFSLHCLFIINIRIYVYDIKRFCIRSVHSMVWYAMVSYSIVSYYIVLYCVVSFCIPIAQYIISISIVIKNKMLYRMQLIVLNIIQYTGI